LQVGEREVPQGNALCLGPGFRRRRKRSSKDRTNVSYNDDAKSMRSTVKNAKDASYKVMSIDNLAKAVGIQKGPS
jgi:hypothetical protein